MTAIILEGHDPAQRVLEQAAALSGSVQAVRHRMPCLALVTADAQASARAYIRRIEAYAASAQVTVLTVDLPTGATTEQAIAAIDQLNRNDDVDGILPLAPFPPDIAFAQIAASILPDKDVDGLTAFNAGQLARGLEGLFPCTPQAAIRLAETAVGPLRGMTATVVGASGHVGRPLAEMLLQRGATVTVAHVDTRDLAAACNPSRLLFVAVGKVGLITDRHVGPGSTVIDIGINAIDDKAGGMLVVGDADRATVAPVAAALSAVPDGVGPLTSAFLIENCATAAMRRLPVSRTAQ